MENRRSSRSRLLTARGVTVTGLVADTLLASGKIAAGVVCHSQTILADGLHSGSDLVTDVAVLAGVRLSDQPADDDHPYGHRRISTLVAMFVGAALFGAGAWIAYSAIVSLHEIVSPEGHPRRTIRAGWPFLLAVMSVPIKEAMFHVTRWVGRRTSNVSLLANAWHHRTDAFSSLAAAAGLAGVLLGGPGWRILDPITAVVLSAFLLVIAVRIVRSASGELIDRAPGEDTMRCIAGAVNRTPGVRSYHAFRARKIGGKVAMDIHVQVDPELTVREGHDIASNVRRCVMQAEGQVAEVIVHIEPAEEERPAAGREGG